MRENEKTANKEYKVVVFRLGEEEYGVDILQVKTIERMMKITRVPKAPSFVEGVVNLRGEIIPIIDLRKRFDLPAREVSENTHIIVVKIEDLVVGMIVDGVTEVMSISQEAIELPPAIIGGINAAYLKGVAKVDNRLIILLNLDRILNIEEISQLEKM